MDFTGRTAFLRESNESGLVVASNISNEKQTLDIQIGNQVKSFSHEEVVILGDMQFNSK